MTKSKSPTQKSGGHRYDRNTPPKYLGNIQCDLSTLPVYRVLGNVFFKTLKCERCPTQHALQVLDANHAVVEHVPPVTLLYHGSVPNARDIIARGAVGGKGKDELTKHHPIVVSQGGGHHAKNSGWL